MEVVKLKIADLNTNDPEQAAKILAGTARQMGLEIEGDVNTLGRVFARNPSTQKTVGESGNSAAFARTTKQTNA